MNVKPIGNLIHIEKIDDVGDLTRARILSVSDAIVRHSNVAAARAADTAGRAVPAVMSFKPGDVVLVKGADDRSFSIGDNARIIDAGLIVAKVTDA